MEIYLQFFFTRMAQVPLLQEPAKGIRDLDYAQRFCKSRSKVVLLSRKQEAVMKWAKNEIKKDMKLRALPCNVWLDG